ncbi:MAG: type IIL restriction-modification enzyme MmeI [Promethearchaeota archaeon]
MGYEEGTIKSTGRVEFSFKNKTGQIIAICEVKGQRIDLDKHQSREKDRRTPVEQAFGYALNMKDVNWIIVTNYEEFRLYNFERKTKYISFKVEDLRELENLKLFKSLFSYQTLIEESLPDKVLSNTFFVEKELTSRFYDLYHETRLMIIKEFEFLGKSLKEALHIAQIILNRVLFVCFAEDSSKGLIESQTLERLLLIPIENKYVDFDGNEIWRTISKFFQKTPRDHT